MLKSPRHPRHPSREVQIYNKLAKYLRKARKLLQAMRGGRSEVGIKYLSYTFEGPPEEMVGPGMVESQTSCGTVVVPGLEEYAKSPNTGALMCI